MPDTGFLSWPFFDGSHRALASELDAWAKQHVAPLVIDDDHDADTTTRELVRRLGAGGWLRHAVPASHGGAREMPDVRSLCIVRETLARYSGLADVAFAMQGLGSAPVWRFGSPGLRDRYLPGVCRGEKVAAIAMTEPNAGSDLAAMRTTARREGAEFVLDGQKSFISNAGVADHYAVFARFPEAGERGFVALMVDADNPGLSVTDRIQVTAPHPLGTLTFSGCRVPGSALVGEAGAGMKVALAVLDVFRPTVGAAALGFARRALDEALEWCSRRETFGKVLAQHQMTQARLAEMALEVDAAALLVYRAAWTGDQGGRVTREAAMAKLYATEAAQRVVDGAVQLFGGRGVSVGETVERLYREVRALRIYEGTSEIQKLVIAAQMIAPAVESV